jgi:hypothetical protein
LIEPSSRKSTTRPLITTPGLTPKFLRRRETTGRVSRLESGIETHTTNISALTARLKEAKELLAQMEKDLTLATELREQRRSTYGRITKMLKDIREGDME